MHNIHLTDDDIAEFQRLYKQETGKDITPEQAREYAERVIGLVAWVYKIGPRDFPE